MSEQELTRLYHIEDWRIIETDGFLDEKNPDLWICEDNESGEGQYWARMGEDLFRNRRDAAIALLAYLYPHRDNLLTRIKELEADLEAERTAWRRREGALCGWEIRRKKADQT